MMSPHRKSLLVSSVVQGRQNAKSSLFGSGLSGLGPYTKQRTTKVDGAAGSGGPFVMPKPSVLADDRIASSRYA
jgi:hypothetical protein